ncbi:MAG: VOC family protein [Microcella sp.]|uniref:VOC family protein n=1 Tax=Microcella sp. TaxID=1913979 RepID=UPI0033159EED
MDLGAFSVSLAVKDLQVSREFYEKLGFSAVGGHAEEGWLMLRNGATTLGLFEGMFDNNILTFNPGWTAEGEDVEGDFTDVRAVQARLVEQGVTLIETASSDREGPAHITLLDPDGNPILIDQHR